ncbi:MAG: hypothetical protein HGA98_06280 [Deltaproteobacteria bacterium]|nr:hypothetical protein [Deltaproteobacteria bacterium]
MARELDDATRARIRDMVFSYFSEECDVPREELTDETHVIEELEGDSLMILALLERVRRENGLTVELKTLGRHLMRKPANNLGQIVALTLAIVQYGDDIVHVDL